MQQRTMNTKGHKWPQCREEESAECGSLDRTLTLHANQPALKYQCRKRGEKDCKSSGRRCMTLHPLYRGLGAHMAQAVQQCEWSAEALAITTTASVRWGSFLGLDLTHRLSYGGSERWTLFGWPQAPMSSSTISHSSLCVSVSLDCQTQKAKKWFADCKSTLTFYFPKPFPRMGLVSLPL